MKSLIRGQWIATETVCAIVYVYIYKPPVCVTESFHSQPDEASCSVLIASLAVAIATCPLPTKVFWHCYADREAKALLQRGERGERTVKSRPAKEQICIS